MSGQAAELAQHLARHAEAVCRHYLSNGRRHGRYWTVGDVHNTPGRSLYVRLAGPPSGPGAAGKWTDAATAEHGDLIDLIAGNRGLARFRDACHEARRFLSLPPPDLPRTARDGPRRATRQTRPAGCFAPECLSSERGPRPISAPAASPGVSTGRRCAFTRRFGIELMPTHPASRGRACSPPSPILAAASPAFIAPWLDRAHPDKAPLADPRRALGHLLGNGVRFGPAEPAPAKAGVLLAGEGIETVLSLKCVLPGLPMIAALSANHLAALDLAPMLARLYVARDRDAAGRMAAERLHARGSAAHIEVRDLVPVCDDFNEDLRRLGPGVLQARLRDQLAPADVLRFLGRQIPRSSAFVAVAACGSGRKGAGIVHPADLGTGQRAARAAFPSGDLPGPDPARNGGRKLFSAAGEAAGFASRNKIVPVRHPPLRYGPLPAEAGCGVRTGSVPGGRSP